MASPLCPSSFGFVPLKSALIYFPRRNVCDIFSLKLHRLLFGCNLTVKDIADPELIRSRNRLSQRVSFYSDSCAMLLEGLSSPKTKSWMRNKPHTAWCRPFIMLSEVLYEPSPAESFTVYLLFSITAIRRMNLPVKIKFIRKICVQTNLSRHFLKSRPEEKKDYFWPKWNKLNYKRLNTFIWNLIA